MKKFFAIVLAGVMMLSLAACGATSSSTPTASEPAAASVAATSSEPAASTLSGKVTTGGSTSVEKVVGAFIEAFMAENSGVDVTYDPTGSGAGITGAAEGTLDIGLSSRALKDDEAKAAALRAWQQEMNRLAREAAYARSLSPLRDARRT